MFKRKLLFVFMLLVISVWISVSFFGKGIERKISGFVYDEVNRVSKIIIRSILNEKFLEKLDLEELFTVEKNSIGEVQLIDFDLAKVNSILGKVNDEIILNFKEFDRGNVLNIYEKSNLFKKYDDGFSTGVALMVPLGVVFSNPVFSNMGPKVPIKLKFNGQVESDINTSIKQYGINNVLLEISIDVKVSEKIVFPFSSEYIDVTLNVPLVIELISGKVPESYLNDEISDIIR